MRMQHRYLDRVMAAATADEPTLAAMMDALFLVAPPESLFRPTVAWRALRRGRPGPDVEPLELTRAAHCTLSGS